MVSNWARMEMAEYAVYTPGAFNAPWIENPGHRNSLRAGRRDKDQHGI